MKTALPRLLIAAPLALLLAACGDKGNAPAPATGTDAAPAAAATPAAKPKREYPADYQIDAAIPRADIRTRLRLVGQPLYQAKDDVVVFNVEVANNGRSPIVSAGSKPVALAVNLVGPEGVDVAPGSRNFRRVRLPLIVEGDAARVRVRVPAAEVDGIPMQLELVQQGVGWWGKYKQPLLDVGPFHRCDDEAGGMCDVENVPLESR